MNVATVIVVVIALGTFAFGAVYPWAFIPLFVTASLVGITGLRRNGLRPELRPVAAGLLLVCAAAAAQLLPMPRVMAARISPATVEVLRAYDLVFADPEAGWRPLSINPRGTAVALLSLCALSVYILGLPGLLGHRAVRSFPRFIAMLAVPLALYGIYTREHNNGLIYGFWQPQDGGGGNQFGPFVNRNHFGGWMLMTLGVLIGSLFGQFEGALRDTGGRRSRRLAWLSSSSANSLLRTAVVVVLGVIGIFWSLSRSSIISLAAAVLLFAWLASRRRRLGATRRILALMSLGAALVAGLAWRGPTRLLAWFQDDRNLLSRFDAWRDAWDVIRTFPLAGTGLNTFGDAMLFYQQRNPGFHMAQAHNDYLQLAAEGGALVVVPAIVATLLLARAIRNNLRMARAESRGYWIRTGATVGLLAVALQEVFEFSLQIPVNAFLFATLAAIALSPVVVSRSTTAAVSRDTMLLPRSSAGVSLS